MYRSSSGVGALTLAETLRNVEAAQKAGAAGLLLSVMTYQLSTTRKCEDVAGNSSAPICVYDNPGTTHVTFTDAMHAHVAALPAVCSIKLPGSPVPAFTDRLETLRRAVPESVTLGVSGDAFAADAMLGGADVWYSVTGRTLPVQALALTQAAQRGERDTVNVIATQLAPLWALFAHDTAATGSLHTSLRSSVSLTTFRYPVRYVHYPATLPPSSRR